jgi:hypothetical protein
MTKYKEINLVIILDIEDSGGGESHLLIEYA